MPTFDVSRSTVINASPAEVFAEVREFKNWPKWSPWLICDPQARLTFSDDGRRYDWEGPVSGSGFIEVTDEKEGSAIDYALTFLKPWKSTNTVGFRFSGRDGGTEVTWTMTGELNLFMRIMGIFWPMDKMVGPDFEKGLDQLATLAEN